MKLPVAVLAALALAAPASATNWTIVPASSTLTFSGTETGAAFTGRFGSWSGQIVYDPANPEAAHVHIVIATSSASSGDKQRDEALPGADWFDGSSFPQAIFDATGFISQGNGKFLTKGTLTIRGIKKPLALPFSLTVSPDHTATAKGSVTLTRTDFGVGQGAWSSGDYVGLKVDVDFTLVAKSS